MERTGVEVKSGNEFNHLFPGASGKTIIIKSDDANVEDTLKLIKSTVAETLEDTVKIAKILKGKTLDETCSNIWHFVFNHIKYKRDEKGKEQVRRPSRTWANRHEGVDCDCMSEFISSILTNLEIPHKHRIAMYSYDRGWQHIYPIVPRNGNAAKEIKNRKDYIVLDCVKYAYNDEEPFIKVKDYDMRLEYLNGPDDEEEQMYEVPQSTDIQDLAAASEFDEGELGKIGQWLKKSVKKIGDTAGKGIRAINKVANPATILLRNGFLLIMKLNLMNVAARLKYAYLSDEQAKARGFNMTEFAKLKKIKEKAETIFWQSGGDKNNLKKAILTGNGNKDRSIPMNGLEGIDDPEEFTAMLNGTSELGVAPAAAIASATAAVTAIAGALSQVKGIFKKNESTQTNSPQQESYDTTVETETMMIESDPESRQRSPDNNFSIKSLVNNALTKSKIQPKSIAPKMATSNRPASIKASSNLPVQQSIANNQGMFSGTLEWVKSNPGKSFLIAAAIGGGTYLLLKKKDTGQTKRKSLNGFSSRKRINKRKTKPGKIKIIRL